MRHFQDAGAVTAEPEKSESTIGKFFRSLPGNRASEYAASPEGVAASKSMAELTREREDLLGKLTPFTAMTPSERTQRESRLAVVDQGLATIRKGRQDYVQGTPPVTPTPAPAAVSTDPTREIELGRNTPSDNQSNASAPPLAPRPSGYAAPAADSGDAAATSAIADVRRSITDLKTRGTAALDALDKGEIDPATGQPIPKKTFADIVASQNEERKKALTAAGLPEQGHKERITELVGQASQARNDRDVDRWMAVAQGFFAMAGGKSQYAMQNMAEGLGVGVKQLQASEKEYRVGEKARLESIATLKQAQRAEELGHIKEATASYEKYQELVQKDRDAKRKSAEHLLTTATQQEQIVATREASLASTKAIRDASLAASAATRAASQEQAAARLGENKRAHIAAERQREANFYLLAEKQHRLNQKGGPLDTALGELEIVQSKLAAKGKSKDPDLLTQKVEIETRIGKHNDTIANESEARAKRMMRVGSSDWGPLETTGGKK